jgi:hypothetical protein
MRRAKFWSVGWKSTVAEIHIEPGELREVRTLQQVVDFLSDELDWPLSSADLEDIVFEYTPEELGIPHDQIPKLTSLRQMRPLVTNQPWGIFFIEFAGPKLPVTPLSRLLRALVTKKRAAGDGSRKTWDLEDLLFIITTDSGDSVELHFVAFFEGDDSKVEIRSLPWRPDQSPEQHLRRLSEELLPRLAWPSESENADVWRANWREAFKLRHGDAIGSSARLAERMAETAHSLRDIIAAALDHEDGSGPFSTLLEEIRHELVADVDAPRFADMCAQTLVYGLLGSRITDPEAFGASPTLSTLPMSNPFLSAFFERIHDQIIELNVDDTKLEQLVADLRTTNVEAILDQFDSTAKGGDPVIHFYEDFLVLYDRKMRADAGAFYTPQPVVEFMVRGVDHILREEFGLEGGVADDAKWADVAQNLSIEVPEGVDPQTRFISMLDPATGTGTFLVEWLEQARRSFQSVNAGGDWPEHLRTVIMPSMHAFELMLAPYAIAHLKVALTVENQGADAVQTNILLTDTLDHPPRDAQFDQLRDPVAVEGQLAGDLKKDEPFTVIIGNPPYDREQRDAAKQSRRKGGVVRHGVPGVDPLLAPILEALAQTGQGVHAKNLYNDYVYFWRWATWQVCEREQKPGVVAFITASSFVEGKSFGSLRSHLRHCFDDLWVVDLGGDGLGATYEENVFDIRTPVAIAIGVNRTSRGSGECKVRYVRLDGSRSEKFAALGRLQLSPEVFAEVDGSGFDNLSPRGVGEYFRWPEVSQLFPWIHSGCQAKRTWPIAPLASTLEQRWGELVGSDPASRSVLLRETRDRKIDSAPGSLFAPRSQPLEPIMKLSSESVPESYARYGYRCLDRQWIIADNRVLDFPRPDLWALASDSNLFLSTLTATRLGSGPVLFASAEVPDMCHFKGSSGAKDVIPVWRDGERASANLTANLIEDWGAAIGSSVEPAAVAEYVYGIGATAAYAARLESEIRHTAGPVRVPITKRQELFSEAVVLGQELLYAHTWGERGNAPQNWTVGMHRATVAEPIGNYPESFSFDVRSEQLVVGSGLLDSVAREVWEFEVSGLKVLRSWLGNRMLDPKGRRSSPLDEINPSEWNLTEELLTLIGILEYTCERTSDAASLLERIIDGPLLMSSDLPTPSDLERKPQKR